MPADWMESVAARCRSGVVTDVGLEPVLARLADAAVDSGRKHELAVICRDAGSPRWCLDAVQRP